jgi:hypothetical protein
MKETRIIRLLKVLIDQDVQDQVRWYYMDNGDIGCYSECSDFFWWGTADGEEITTREDIELLVKAIEDCRAVDSTLWAYGPLLYCARKRTMRPQGAAYPYDKRIWFLFNQAGEQRETGLGNPYKPGEKEEKRKLAEKQGAQG